MWHRRVCGATNSAAPPPRPPPRPPPSAPPNCFRSFLSSCYLFLPARGATRQRQCRGCGWWALRNAFRVRARVAGGARRPAVRGARRRRFFSSYPPPPAPHLTVFPRPEEPLACAGRCHLHPLPGLHPRPTPPPRVDARVHVRYSLPPLPRSFSLPPPPDAFSSGCARGGTRALAPPPPSLLALPPPPSLSWVAWL